MRGGVRHLARRVAAYTIDIVILAAVLIPFAFGVQSLVGYRPDTGIGVWLASVVTISVPSWTYFTLSDASGAGATLGKRLLGLRVATDDGSRLGIGRALLRTAIKLLQLGLLVAVYALLALYLVVALRNGGARSVHDRAVGTVVRRQAA